MMGVLANKSAVITGAGTGIGKGIAERFATEGANVVVVDRQEATGLAVVDGLQQQGANAIFALADVGVAAQMLRAIGVALEQFGSIDVMVNNAGIIHRASVLETEEADWDRVIQTNLRSCFLGSKYAAQAMIDHQVKGRIINISSIHATLSEPFCSAYTASKGGIEAFTRTLATELAVYGITANCVAPGATYTELTKPMYTPAATKALFTRIPLQAIAEPKDIAHAALFLASDDSWYITGTTLTVDGGYTMNGTLPDADYW